MQGNNRQGFKPYSVTFKASQHWIAVYIGFSYKLSHTVKPLILYYSVCTVLHRRHEKLCSSTDSEKNKQIQCMYLWQHSWCPSRSGTNPRRTQRSGCKASWSTAITSWYFLISPFSFFSKTLTLAGHSVPFPKPCISLLFCDGRGGLQRTCMSHTI